MDEAEADAVRRSFLLMSVLMKVFDGVHWCVARQCCVGEMPVSNGDEGV